MPLFNQTLVNQPELFIDQNDGKLKYRESSTKKVFEVSLFPNAFKNCIYQFPGDEGGVFYWIGTNFGTTRWSNPALSNNIEIITTGDNGNKNNLVDRQRTDFYTSNVANASIIINLHLRRTLIPSGYLLRNRANDPHNHPRTWNLFGKNLQNNWEILDTQTNNQSLNAPDAWLYIPTPNITKEYNSFEIRQTGVNSSGANFLCLGEIELYGSFR